MKNKNYIQEQVDLIDMKMGVIEGVFISVVVGLAMMGLTILIIGVFC